MPTIQVFIGQRLIVLGLHLHLDIEIAVGVRSRGYDQGPDAGVGGMGVGLQGESTPIYSAVCSIDAGADRRVGVCRDPRAAGGVGLQAIIIRDNIGVGCIEEHVCNIRIIDAVKRGVCSRYTWSIRENTVYVCIIITIIPNTIIIYENTVLK
jgi:hypothetical protein